MTDYEKRSTIAKYCGWQSAPALIDDSTYWWNPQINNGELGLLPEYLTDLNAMHEAEKSLTHRDHGRYALELVKVSETTPATHASAAQRAEAFLTIINQTKP